jgi:hypothetical protein
MSKKRQPPGIIIGKEMAFRFFLVQEEEEKEQRRNIPAGDRSTTNAFNDPPETDSITEGKPYRTHLYH